jgi:hypothetical protein
MKFHISLMFIIVNKFNNWFLMEFVGMSMAYLQKSILLEYILVGGPGSSVGIATDYGLDGTGIESRWSREF